MVKVKEDLTGKAFGNWKVIERVADKISKSGQARAAYLCECQCEKNFIFDKEDYNKINKFTWFKDKNGYAVSSVKQKERNKKHTYRVHRVILEIENREIEIDHKNRKTWDNRKSNLRITNHRNNSYNCSIQKRNTSGFIGVSYEKKSGKWRAFLCRNRKYLLSKSFALKDEAIKARLKAELEYYGIEYAPQRHLFKEYGII